MSFLKKVFKGSADSETETNKQPSNSSGSSNSGSSISSFGRYTDINKTKTQVEYWKKANDSFKAGEYVNSFEYFLHYLKDETVENVKFSRNGNEIEFEFIQGSKVIRGKADETRFFAESPIVIMEENSMPVMRKLMSLNYVLRYSKFALKDHTIYMKFSSHALDASPGKLYDALKELARKADQQDDLLTQEFSSLKEINTDSIIELPEAIKMAKYEYLIGMIQSTKEEIKKHDPSKMAGGIAFLLLNLTYKIDYLITPQGELTDALERIQRLFFARNNQSTLERNNEILHEYEQIVNTPKEKILEGIYDVKATFAIANAATHKSVMDMMFKEREKVGWYRDENYPQIVEAIYEYMVSYAFFNYGMVYPVSKILNLVLCVMNPDFYEQCSSSPRLNENGILNGSAISKEIQSIIKSAKKDYPNIEFNTAVLNFTSVALFVDSLILELDKLNLSKN
ncbi:MAG: hypothetical protein WDZ35_00165 [Crocinitomicaceae bacterium]